MRYLALVLVAATLIIGCTETPEIVELHPKDAADAIAGVSHPGSQYVDILANGNLLLFGTPVSRDQFRTTVAKLVAQGDRCLTVRVAEGSSKESFEFVRQAAADTGIQTLEVVRVPVR